MDAYFEMLNSEKRVLEDRLYEVEYNYEQALKELESFREQAEKEPAVDGSSKPSKPPTPEFRAPPQRDQKPSKSRTSEPLEVPSELPKIELPPGFEDGARKPSTPSVFRKAASRTERDAIHPVADSATSQPVSSRKPTSDQELAAALVAALDHHVDHIYIDPRSTSGVDLDGHPGDDGISVWIEPRNKNGQFLEAPGPVTIALLDPSVPGEGARVARWDFDQADVAKSLEQGPPNRGFHFQVPWPDAEPCSERLHLFIRYVAEDGRKVEADREISVRLVSRVAQGWTPRPDRGESEAASGEVPVSWTQDEGDNTPTAIRAVGMESLPSPRSTNSPTEVGGSSKAPGRFWMPFR
jgi:hypothetical protein